MFSFINNLIKHKYLLVNLTSREIKSRYKQSVVGYFWIILNPFFQMLILSFVFSFIIKIPQRYGIPFNLFLYSGILPWTLFVTSAQSSTDSLVSNASLLKKIYFPREIFIVATTIAKIYDFFLASTVFVLFMIILRIKVSSLIVFLPFILLVQIFFTLGLSFFLSSFNLFYRDVKYMMNLVFMLWFYLTPIIYPVEIFPQRYRFIFQLNPMSVLINALRRSIFGGGTLNWLSIAIAIVLSLTLFEIGYRVFKKLEGTFADVV